MRKMSVLGAGAGSAWPGLVLLVGTLALLPIRAQAPGPEIDLTALDLADLMQIEVTSAAKKEQPLKDAAAAIHIITREDLRRSGATNIPEALRLVPGMDVAQLNGSIWAVSARGFNSRFANKMLVLMDGRSLYSPLFAGTFWDVQDTMIADIERIEVIRGPGATLWGANAVNGVINIITQPAEATQGNLVTANVGSENLGVAFRHGGKLGTKGHFRLYAKKFDVDDQVNAAGADAGDGWEMVRAGFRMDWSPNRGQATFQGDVYDGDTVVTEQFPILAAPYVETIADRNELSGFNLIGRWTQELSADSGMTVQAYVDQTDRDSQQASELRRTFDVEFQHRNRFGSRHEFVWGAGFRTTTDEISNTSHATFAPAERRDNLFNAFVQDDIRLAADRFRLTLGTKIEHNDYSGWELQPNIRGLWRVGPRTSLWGAASRAVRSPARAFSDVQFDLMAFPDPLTPGLTDVVVLFGSPDFESEELLAYEVGFRICPNDRSCFDSAVFLHDYDNLTSVESGVPFLETLPVTRVVIPQTLGNGFSGETRGVELSYTRKLSRRIRLTGWYSRLSTSFKADPGSTDTSDGPEGESPENQASLRLSLNLPSLFEVDLGLHYRDELKKLGVPDYTRMDARVAWAPSTEIEVAVVLQNLLDSQHPEFGGDSFAVETEIERRVLGTVAWRF